MKMKEHPILMNAESVRGILEGRKTMTRRPMKPQWGDVEPKEHSQIPGCWIPYTHEGKFDNSQSGSRKNDACIICPYGISGDRLWVRETLIIGARNNPEPRYNHLWRYSADNNLVMVDKSNEAQMLVWAHHKETEICVSIHMPHWASRLTLEIVNINVERVQDITEQDAKKEGIIGVMTALGIMYVPAFSRLWDSIHGKNAWIRNDWIWVIEFKVIPSGKKDVIADD